VRVVSAPVSAVPVWKSAAMAVSEKLRIRRSKPSMA
jgi:hypothetical protein